jgi:starch synthase (maltosyl-transferring)
VAISPPRVCDLGTLSVGDAAHGAVADAAKLGFTHILLADGADPDIVKPLLDAAKRHALHVLVSLDLFEFPLRHPWVEARPDLFAVRREAGPGRTVDPRHIEPADGRAYARVGEDKATFIAWWSQLLEERIGQGTAGFVLRHPDRLPAKDWCGLLTDVRKATPDTLFVADTIGVGRRELAALAGSSFDHCLSSLPWWDMRAPWLIEEYEVAARVAPVLACIGAAGKLPPATGRARRALLALAALTGSGVVAPAHFARDADEAEGDLETAVMAMNALVASEPIVAAPGALQTLSGLGAPIDVLLRAGDADMRTAQQALVALINPDVHAAAALGDDVVSATLGDWQLASTPTLAGGTGDRLAPGEVRLFRAERRKPVLALFHNANAAAAQPRIVIEAISPDGEAFAVKRVVGDAVTVEADIFTDGHPLIAAELLFHAEDEQAWQRTPMRLVVNDRWAATLPLRRVGRHRFMIEAWLDQYGGFARDLGKKRDAGRDITIDLQEGVAAIDAAAARTTCALQAPLAAIKSAFAALDDDAKTATLLAPETIEAMRRADIRAFRAQSAVHAIDADRIGARFASWYELFPRSQTNDPSRHGTFADVVARLPAIRAMGFDVLYLPPIHPIGKTNRKGRNNTLTPAADDPGSVYAIGSPDGGHDTVHPQLGTLDEFRALISAAHAHGLEMALDFAVQCSPDHPWLRQHPGWFDWRADGSIKYAENPPKLYEDIVNVDFYAPDAVPNLWLALRDIVLFWAGQGVRIFRVDNPHTKPFAFWQWLIADVRAANPDILFLAEAFTRPKIMYRLARLGFTQSYTYFTWRNTKQELTEYMRELAAPPVSDFFRPHFFANTPDINPVFLQGSGRAGFLIRAALAATLSGLWGIYSGFELCEAAALPGREEYDDSEKYAVKPRDWNAPGNIIAEIAQLNAIRKSEPALQTHLGITFHNAANPNILYFAKHAPGDAGRILVAINLDPHNAQGADIEIPLWEWSLPDSGALAAEDLLSGARFVWHGKMQHIHLAPDAPYRIWRISPAAEI